MTDADMAMQYKQDNELCGVHTYHRQMPLLMSGAKATPHSCCGLITTSNGHYSPQDLNTLLFYIPDIINYDHTL